MEAFVGRGDEVSEEIAGNDEKAHEGRPSRAVSRWHLRRNMEGTNGDMTIHRRFLPLTRFAKVEHKESATCSSIIAGTKTWNYCNNYLRVCRRSYAWWVSTSNFSRTRRAKGIPVAHILQNPDPRSLPESSLPASEPMNTYAYTCTHVCKWSRNSLAYFEYPSTPHFGSLGDNHQSELGPRGPRGPRSRSNHYQKSHHRCQVPSRLLRHPKLLHSSFKRRGHWMRSQVEGTLIQLLLPSTFGCSQTASPKRDSRQERL